MKNKLLILFLGISGWVYSQTTITNIQVKNLDGTEIALSEIFDGKRNTLISIGGTWCKPCLLQKPFVASLGHQYPQYLKVIYLFWNDTAEKISSKFGDKKDLSNYYIATQAIIDRFNVSSYPTHILLDPYGNSISNDVSINDVGSLIKK